jgi:hypothetical protein
MNRGSKFEQKVGSALKRLCTQYPKYLEVFPQFPVKLSSGRRADIDFKLLVRFAHENQSYYFELQSRNKHDHALTDKIEAVRRDTTLSTFSFVHESPLEASVAKELASRNVVIYDWKGFCNFLSGVELQVLQLRRAREESRGRVPSGRSRLRVLVNQLVDNERTKQTREIRRPESNSREGELAKEILAEVARGSAGAIRQVQKFRKF